MKNSKIFRLTRNLKEKRSQATEYIHRSIRNQNPLIKSSNLRTVVYRIYWISWDIFSSMISKKLSQHWWSRTNIFMHINYITPWKVLAQTKKPFPKFYARWPRTRSWTSPLSIKMVNKYYTTRTVLFPRHLCNTVKIL